jgi:hypothetical protein
MTEVFEVWIPYEGPSKRYPSGRSAVGHYTIAGDILTLTDPKGKVAEDQEGKTYTAKLAPGDNRQEVGGALTMRLRAVLRGENPDAPTRVSRPLNYPKGNGGYF